MRKFSVIALIACTAQAHVFSDNVADGTIDKLVNRGLKAPQDSADFDGSTLGKTSTFTAPQQGPALAVTAPRAGLATRALPITQGLRNGNNLYSQNAPAMISNPFSTQGQRAQTTEKHCVQAVVLRAEVAKKYKKSKMVDGREVPFNLFTRKEPLKAKVVKNEKYPQTITGNTGDPNWETVHVTFDHGGNYPYLEGMSLGLMSPGPDKNGKSPAAPRLYSIASSAVGDDQTGKTVSLCVKRVVEVDGKFANREVGEDKPDKAGTHYPENRVYRGVASNYICDLNVGDEVEITGPVGTEMLLPSDPTAPIIMLATGTGIAPMRSYLRLLFNDKAGEAPDGSRIFKGLAWLFLGVPYSKSLLYDDENVEYKKNFPDQYRYEYAISREQTNAAGQKMYIQTKLAEYAEEVWDLMMNSKAQIYMCGLKGMESGMQEALGPIAEKKGLVWAEVVKGWKKEDRYHVEVY